MDSKDLIIVSDVDEDSGDVSGWWVDRFMVPKVYLWKLLVGAVWDGWDGCHPSHGWKSPRPRVSTLWEMYINGDFAWRKAKPWHLAEFDWMSTWHIVAHDFFYWPLWSIIGPSTGTFAGPIRDWPLVFTTVKSQTINKRHCRASWSRLYVPQLSTILTAVSVIASYYLNIIARKTNLWDMSLTIT